MGLQVKSEWGFDECDVVCFSYSFSLIVHTVALFLSLCLLENILASRRMNQTGKYQISTIVVFTGPTQRHTSALPLHGPGHGHTGRTK